MALNATNSNLAENEQKILHAGRIPYESFRNAIITIFSISCLTFTARIITRLSTRRRLYFDDFFIILGFIILSGTTYVMLHFGRSSFVSEAIVTDLVGYVTINDLLGLSNFILVSQAHVCMTWTTIFCVKFSFLALFKGLIRRLSRRITIFYWTIVLVTILTWVLLAFSMFIICPNASSCAQKQLTWKTWNVEAATYKFSLVMGIIVPVLDIVTDVMIVSIPVLVLNQTQMKLSRKVGLGIFLCLSVVMALIALVRVAGYRIQGKIDVTWQSFWQYMEACVAIIMGSATAFRTLFLGENSRKPPEKKASHSFRLRLLRRHNFTDEKCNWEGTNGGHLPTVPSATLSGLRTFIHRHGRTKVGLTTGQSDLETLPHDKDGATFA